MITKIKQRPKWRIGSLLPLGAALTGMAFAAEPVSEQPSTDEEITLPALKVKAAREREPAFKADTASTATRYEARLLDIPQSVSVVKKELIESQNAFNLRDALKNVSGLSIAAGEGGRTGDSITLRGFSANSDTYLDSVKENGQYFRDTFFLERVEVLKGASSVLFGRGATGGVINQIAKKPQKQMLASGQFVYGSFDFKRATTDLNIAPNDQLGVRMNALYQDAGSFRNYNYTNRWGLAPSLKFDFTPDTDITLYYLHQQESSVFDYGVPMYLGKPANVNIDTFYGFPDDRLQTFNVNIPTAVLTHRFSDDFSIVNTVRYGDYERNYRTLLFGAVTNNGLASTIARSEALRLNTQQNLYNQTSLILKQPVFGLNNTLLLGMTLGSEKYNFLSKDSTGVPSVSIFNPILTATVGAGRANDLSGVLAINRSTTAQTYAGYMTDQFELTPEWKLLGGARYEVFEAKQDDRVNNANDFSRTDRQWNPRAGLVWEPAKWQSYYASYATSFNPSAEAYTLAANNANIGPEQNRNFEIGAKFDLLDGRLSATGALFRLEKTNARTTDPNDPTQLILAGEQRTDGFELGLAGEILPDWNVSLAYAYLNAKIVKSSTTAVGSVSGTTQSLQGKVPINVPANSGVVWTSYHLTPEWEIGGGVFFSTQRYTDTVNEVTLPGYARLDAIVAYHQPHFDIQVNAFNLTDATYYESGQTYSALPGVPISAQVSLNLKY
ncbi:TonB-dependent siderophore receptor [Candidatus Methylospira mobilis]|uniref:TonB-dependent receptor n=1 Tax=Candidatus Methylospira mobilis TaxID=1808979 RepID=UPI0028EB684B|nr:TonB-dependent siderophore receptor [Candidatus Methylospira mobilis]WNV06327.1 TonB-dependent siderophore receptor [Candidatus Methylospira mobilis]